MLDIDVDADIYILYTYYIYIYIIMLFVYLYNAFCVASSHRYLTRGSHQGNSRRGGDCGHCQGNDGDDAKPLGAKITTKPAAPGYFELKKPGKMNKFRMSFLGVQDGTSAKSKLTHTVDAFRHFGAPISGSGG